MGRLSERDYQAVLRIVVAAAAAPADCLTRPLLDEVRALFAAADTLAFFEGVPWDRARRRRVVSGDYRPWTVPEMVVMDAYRHQLPLGPGPATINRAVRITDAMSLKAYRQTDLYRLAGRAHDVEYSMDFWATSELGIVRGLSLDSARRDFTDRERELLEILGRALTVVAGRQDGRVPPAGASLGLTSRERQVIALVAKGRTNREIAGQLVLSEHTVRKHLEHVYATLGVHTRTQAVARLSAEAARDQSQLTAPDPTPS